MLKKRVMKIAKNLQKFELDDIITLAECDEQDAIDIIESLIKENTLIKIDETHFKYELDKKELSFKIHFNPNKILLDQALNKGNILFKTAAIDFLINYVQDKVSPSTLKLYKSLIKIHLVPYFGNIYLKDITSKDIKGFIEKKQNKRISDKTINNCVTLLGNMLKRFVEKGYINNTPYNKVINVSFNKRNPVKILTEIQIQSLLELAKLSYPDIYPLILLTLTMGLKRGEVLGLKVKDIDFINMKISINQTFYEGELFIPRTKSVFRTLDIPESLDKILQNIVQNKKLDDLLFFNQMNISADTRLRKRFYSLAIEAGLCGLKFNELRHTYAYFMLQSSASIEYLHKQLGDYSIQATMDKYRDFIPKKDFRAKMLLCLKV